MTLILSQYWSPSLALSLSLSCFSLLLHLALHVHLQLSGETSKQADNETETDAYHLAYFASGLSILVPCSALITHRFFLIDDFPCFPVLFIDVCLFHRYPIFNPVLLFHLPFVFRWVWNFPLLLLFVTYPMAIMRKTRICPRHASHIIIAKCNPSHVILFVCS